MNICTFIHKHPRAHVLLLPCCLTPSLLLFEVQRGAFILLACYFIVSSCATPRNIPEVCNKHPGPSPSYPEHTANNYGGGRGGGGGVGEGVFLFELEQKGITS